MEAVICENGKKVCLIDTLAQGYAAQPIAGCHLFSLTHHTHTVASVAISPDAKTIVTGSYDTTAILWDIGSKGATLIATLSGHKDFITCVAYSPDGAILATGSVDQTVILWDSSGNLITSLSQGHKDRILCLAFSVDGKVLATGSKDKTAILWDIARCSVITILAGHKHSVTSVTFSPNGKIVATSSLDRTAIVWGVATGKIITTLPHNDCVSSVAFSPNGKLIATGCNTCNVELWDAANFTKTATLQGHGQLVTCVAFSRDSSIVASGCADNSTKLWDVIKRAPVATLVGHRGHVTSVVFGPDDKTLITGSNDKTAILWSLSKGSIIATIPGHNSSSIECFARSSDGKMIATGSRDKTAIIWDAASGGVLKTLSAHGDAVTSIAFNNDGTMLATGSDDKTVKLWDVAKGSVSSTLSGHQGENVVKFSKDGKEVQSVSGGITKVSWKIDGTPKDEQVDAGCVQWLSPRSTTFVKSTIDLYKSGNDVPISQESKSVLSIGLSTLPPFLLEKWNSGGSQGKAVVGFAIERFDAVVYEANSPAVMLRDTLATKLAGRKASGLPEFRDDFSKFTPAQQLSKRAVVEYMNQQFVLPFTDTNIIFTFHGCKVSSVKSILSNGFINLAREDNGYFGSGVYVTTSIEYAAKYATGVLSGGGVSPAVTMEDHKGEGWPLGSYPVLCCASTIGVAYPVTPDTDYEIGSKTSVYYAPPNQPAKALKGCSDAHIVPVHSAKGYQAVDPDFAEYYEIVHRDENLILPSRCCG